MESGKEYSKWRSRRWLITVWSMAMVTGIFVVSAVTGSEQWGVLATTLVAVPVAYTSLETMNKRGQRNGGEGK